MIKAVILSLMMVSSVAFAQQIPQYSQWYLHQFAGNPAHAGIKQCVDIHTLYRAQWVNFDGAPQSGFLTVSIPIQARRRKYLSARHGTGFKFERDQIGQFDVNRLSMAYAAHFNFDKVKRLSLGLYGGVMQLGYDPTKTHTADPDPAAMQQGSFVVPDATFGAWFNAENYYVGLSLKNLIPSKWPNVGVNSHNRFHASLNAGYRLAINDNFTMIPAANLRLPPKGPLSVDLNVFLDYSNLLSFGIGYRNTDAVIGLVSLKIKEQFAITYSFDYTLSAIQQVANNTHEISLRFTTCKQRRSTSASCPMFE